MSKQVDERVVSMQFDNAQFERNVRTSMSTLDKLKQKLNFKGTTDGLEKVGASVKKVNFTGLSSGIQTVQAQFSALEVIGVTALANITNQAVNAGKRMVNALTLEPVMTGFQEYETQINAVQTILSNTKSKGSTIEDVNAALDELNLYADKTIYNFTEMTRNIGTFTAAGVGLEKSVTSIKGIANLAAVSGSTSLQASTAMYQLSQALAAGRVSLMDWNSVVNAGMGGELFQNALKRTATHMGTDVDSLIEKYGSFRESLTRGQWLTADVLTETLTQLSGAYTEADLIAQGYTEQQAKEITDLANTAVDAATKVKTFSQLWDTMKEAVQSGWAQTWRTIIGDYEEAKVLFSEISEFFTGDNGIITKMSNARNDLLTKALSETPFSGLAERIKEVTGVTEEMTAATQDFGKIVDRVIGGEFGNGEKRIKALTEAGFDWAHVQNLVNERLGDSTRHATDYKEAQEEVKKSQAATVEQLVAMSDAQLRSLGFTTQEISAFHELAKQSEATGIPIKDLVENLDSLNGRTLLINSFKNAAQGLVKIFSSVGKAYRAVFPAMKADQLYNMIAALHKFSTGLIMSDESAGKLYRTFRGLFSLLDIASTIVGGGLKIGFKVLTGVLSNFNLSVLDVTAGIGDMIYNFSKTVDSFVGVGVDLVTGFIQGIQNGTAGVIEFLRGFAEKILTTVKEVLGIHSPSTEMYEIGKNVVQGFVNGVKASAGIAYEVLSSIASRIIDILGNIEWGKVFAVGASFGLLYMVKKIADAFETLASPLEGLGDVLSGFGKTLDGIAFEKKTEGVKNLGIAIGILAASVFVLAQLNTGDLLKAVAAIAVLAGVMAAFSIAMGKYGPKETLKFAGFAMAIVGVAQSILIMTFALKRLEKTDPDKLGVIIAGFGIIVGSLMGILAMYGAISRGSGGADISRAGNILLKLSASLLIMTGVIKLMSSMSLSDIVKGEAAIVAFVAVMAVLSNIMKGGKALAGLGATLAGMAASLAILVMVIKLISGLSAGEILKGAAAIVAFVGILALLATITTFATPIKGLAGTLLGMALALAALALVVKLIAGISVGDLVKGTVALLAFTGILALLAGITTYAKPVKGLGATLLSMSVAIGLLAGIAVLLSMVDTGGLVKGITAVGLLSTFMSMMILATKGARKVQGSIIALMVAVGVMAAAVAALSFIDPAKLAPATIALTMLMGMFALMETAGQFARGSLKSMVTITAVVAALAGVVFLLSQLDMDGAVEKSAAVSLLLLSMSASIALLDNTKGMSLGAIGAVAAMTAVVAALAGILWLIRDLPVESSLSNAEALSTILLSMSACLGILTIIGLGGPAALTGTASLLALVVSLGAVLTAIGALTSEFPQLEQFLEKGIPVLDAIGKALGSFLGNIAGGFIEGASNGLPAAGENIAAFIENVTSGIGNLSNVDNDAVKGANNIAEVIMALTGATVVNSIGNLFGGGKGMESFAAKISSFADAMVDFSDTISGKIDPDLVTSVANAGKALAEMQAYQGLSGVFSIFGGEQNLETFGTQIKAFGEAMVGFSETVSGEGTIDPEAIKAAADAGKIMTELQGAVQPVGGVLQLLSGTKDLGAFGEQLKSFGTAIVSFSDSVTGEGTINADAIQAAADAGSIMAELQNGLAPVNGVLQLLSGTKDLGYFGQQLKAYGAAVVGLSDVLTNGGGIDEAAISSAANAGKVMAELQNNMPKTSGLVDIFSGTQNLAWFGAQIKDFGMAIVGFSNAVSDGGGIDEAAVNAAGNAGQIMASLQAAIPENKLFDGKSDLSHFGNDIKQFGYGIAGFASAISDVSFESTTSAINAADNLTSLAGRIVDVDLSVLGNFNEAKKLGSALSGYVSKISEIDFSNFASSISAAQQLVDLLKGMIGLDVSGATAFNTAITTLGNTSIEAFIKAFDSSTTKVQNVGSTLVKNVIEGIKKKTTELKTTGTTVLNDLVKELEKKKTDFKTTAETLLSEFVNGIKGKQTEVQTSFNPGIELCITSVRGYYDRFKDAGGYLVSGFAAGITANTFIAEARAAAMARAALEAAEAELDINSPSKEFYRVGDFAGQGFVNALGDYESASFKAGASMAGSARSGLSGAIGKIRDLINGDLDAQPTIRPVVDLSNVSSGASAIKDMLGVGTSIGLLTNVGRIGAAVDRNNQNGSNDDVIMAINRLRKGLDSMGGGNNYTINGISYDDGSNVSEAVRSLIRAAKIERRT